MPRRILLIALATVGVLAVTMTCSEAQAREITVTQAKGIADAAMLQLAPDHRCVGQLRVIVNPWLVLVQADGETQPDDTCNIEILPGLDAAHRCDTIVHEALHRGGLNLTMREVDGTITDHHDPAGIMSKYGGRWPACHPVVPLRRQYHDALVGLLPVPARLWRVSCAPLARVTSCRASREGSVTRRYGVQRMRQSFLVREHDGIWTSFEREESA